MQTQIEGVRETIVALRRLDPELRKEFNRQARKIAQPIVNEARGRYTSVPLSGMNRRWAPSGRQVFPFTTSDARKGVRVKIDTSKRLRAHGETVGRPVGIVAIKQTNVAAIVFDMAGKATESGLSRQLSARHGGPSRVMWPAAETHLDGVSRDMQALVNDAARTVDAAVRKAD